MKRKLKTVLRVSVFWLVFLVVFLFLNAFFQPYWVGGFYNNFETYYGFYEEPKNTNEVLFIGPSIGVNGVIPTELYRDFGICAYNLSGEKQPMLASYYWLEEAYNHHPETLKTVFLEVAGTRTENDSYFHHKALDGMRFGLPKINAVLDYSGGNLSQAANFFFPLINYHNRWDETDLSELEKFSYDPINGTRGYGLVTTVRTEKTDAAKYSIKSPVLPARETVVMEELNARAVDYLDKMVAFCEEKGLELIFYKTPSYNWLPQHHYAIEDYCKTADVEFLDFNFGTLASEWGFLDPFDSQDGNHMNYFGASKFTNWIGKYLTEKGATDVRGNEKYAYLEEHLARYNEHVTQKIALQSACTPGEYLQAALSYDNAVFISLRGDAAKNLSQEDRDLFESLGLSYLPYLGENDLYCGVVEPNAQKTDPVTGEVTTFTYVNESLIPAGMGEAATISGTLKNGTAFSLTSGAEAAILLNDKDVAPNKAGINIAVYNFKEENVSSKRSFDTHTASRDDRYNLTLAYAAFDESFVAEAQENRIYQDVLAYQERLEKAANPTSSQN